MKACCDVREEMRDFHDLLRQKASFLFTLLGFDGEDSGVV
jgi:hypothetical protein